MSNLTNSIQITSESFDQLADAVCQTSGQVERVLLWLTAESSDFVRFNQASVRQTTRVNQCSVSLAVIKGQQRLSSQMSLGADFKANAKRLIAERNRLASNLSMVPDDPHLLLPDTITSTNRQDADSLIPDHNELIKTVLQASQGTDMVGFYAGGPMVRAFGDSRGQRNWHEVSSFHFDWSLYLNTPDANDRAVKTSYAARQWDASVLAERMAQAQEQIEPLSRKPVSIEPGKYRAFLAPAAMAEVLGGLAWSGFSRKDRATGTSALSLLDSGEQTMSAQIVMQQATGHSTAPSFTDTGFVLPDTVPLIDHGKAVGSLVSPRSSAEFSEPPNAGPAESPDALDMSPGKLARPDALAALDTGIWISNLWYLNYVDRPACRMTGMTRFATFWVENGKIIAPLNVMRFDDSILRLFGDSLEALTNEAEFMPDPSTWGERHLGSVTAPGALIKDMTFTL